MAAEVKLAAHSDMTRQWNKGDRNLKITNLSINARLTFCTMLSLTDDFGSIGSYVEYTEWVADV